MKRILNQARKDPAKPCLQFRYDDDDAVSVDFIRLLRETADDVAPLCKRHRSVGFDWSNGYVAEVGKEGISATQIFRNLYVASLGMYVRGGDKLTIMNFAHERLNRFMPVISNAEEPMWVRTHNGYNDSRQKKVRPVPVDPVTPELSAEFAARFAIEEDEIKRVFSD